MPKGISYTTSTMWYTMTDDTFTYSNTVQWTGEHKGTLSHACKPDIEFATPPEFGGHDCIISPEDLFVSSINTCFMTTFLAFAKKADINLRAYHSTASGTLSKVEGKRQFTIICLAISIDSDAGDETIAHLIGMVKQHSIAVNSIKAQVDVVLT